jgi:UDP-N-acetylglucosamine--N-acetylmuramyl-(pentapeptide) pyrophosphoryl-undecaprenol N-acetylglucosamine transferase
MTMVNNNKKILIMAGGTGGHVFPALSIAEDLISRGVQVEWLGTRNGLEARVIAATEIPMHFISIAGLRGTSLLRKLLAPLVIFIAVLQSIFKVIQIKPGCVLGMGGFVTGPGGLAAWLLRKKLVIHEQNAIAGLTNQLLFPMATTVMEAFPGAFERKKAMTGNRFLKAFIRSTNIIVVGNPVRKEIADLGNHLEEKIGEREQENESGRNLHLLIIGGSLGAVAINKVIPEMLALLPEGLRPDVLHQCGDKNLSDTEAFYQQHHIHTGAAIRVIPFIENMAEAYAWSDIIIARAGAMTISEITAVGLASILVPYPYAVDDHQTENASFLQRAGGAEIIQQDELNAQRLLAEVGKFSADSKALHLAWKNARNVGKTDASEKAALLCLEACHA